MNQIDNNQFIYKRIKESLNRIRNNANSQLSSEISQKITSQKQVEMLTMNSKNVNTNLNNSLDIKLTYTFLEPQTNVLSTNANTINEYKKIDQEYPQMKEILNNSKIDHILHKIRKFEKRKYDNFIESEKLIKNNNQHHSKFSGTNNPLLMEKLAKCIKRTFKHKTSHKNELTNIKQI